MFFALATFAIGSAQPDWKLTYEKSHFKATGTYSESVAFCRRLEKSSAYAKVIRFGTSPQGRPMIALVISKEKSFTGVKAQASHKPLVVVNNGIHSGEIEGKDASLILARQILVTKERANLIDRCNIVIIPIFSVDAHERSSPYNRINQNGPESMGWRVTAQNLNLNRDFMKVDGIEMRGMVALLHQWKPDFFFDNHTTDGADFRYVLTYSILSQPSQDPGVAKWAKQMEAVVMPKVDANGYPTAPYFGLNDRLDPAKGISDSDFTPRFSTGYLTALNRPSMLVETHMLKAYRPRVEATLVAMVHVIEYCGSHAAELKAANRRADQAEAKLKPGTPIVLTSNLSNRRKPFVFKAYKVTAELSDVTGAKIPRWSKESLDVPTFIQNQCDPDLVVKAPAGYLVPQEWQDVVDRLRLHGIKIWPIARGAKFKGIVTRMTDVKFPREPFEGRFQPTFTAKSGLEAVNARAGDLWVPTNQVGAKLILHLLEAEAPDSFVHWGFFNAIFEMKEYFEDYSMEPIAAKMLRDDPKLKAEFDEKLKDPAFAKSPGARLDFVYRRSPYFDSQFCRYPVVKFSETPQGLTLRNPR